LLIINKVIRSSRYNSIGSFTNKQLEEIDNAQKNDTTKLPLLTAKQKQDALNYFSKKLFDNKFLQDGLKAIPYIGAAVSFLDSFFGGGATAEPQQVKLMPMAINMTTTFEGTITTEEASRPILLDNPGGKDAGIGTSLPSEYPTYNEAMGTFTVLSLPKIEKMKVYLQSPFPFPSTPPVDVAMCYKFTQPLAQNFKFVLNPASGLNASKIEIKAALVFDFDNIPQQPFLTTSVVSLNNNLELDAKTPTTLRYRSPYMPLSMINELTSTYGFDIRSTFTRSFPIFITNLGLPPREVFLKIIVSLTRNNATPTTQNILYVQTFSLRENYTSVPYDQIPPIPAQSKIPENIYFRSDSTIAPQPANQPQSAWGSLIVEPNVTYATGNNQYFCLGGVFYEENASPIPPTYQVFDYLPYVILPAYQQYSPQADITFIQSACATTYKNQSQRWAKAEKDTDLSSSNASTLSIPSENFIVAPNPANEKVTISYQLNTVGQVKIWISNTLGVVVREIVQTETHEKGNFEANIDTQHLASGLYICTLQTAEGISSQKLIINR
jgi:hypothetical protein